MPLSPPTTRRRNRFSELFDFYLDALHRCQLGTSFFLRGNAIISQLGGCYAHLACTCNAYPLCRSAGVGLRHPTHPHRYNETAKKREKKGTQEVWHLCHHSCLKGSTELHFPRPGWKTAQLMSFLDIKLLAPSYLHVAQKYRWRQGYSHNAESIPGSAPK